MSQKFTVIEKPAIQYLCGLIRDLANVSEGVDDLNLRSDGTFSSVKIDALLNTLKTDCNEYTDRLVANLSRLELKIANAESEITQPNIMYLYKPSGATSYEQYVVIEGTKVLLGTCDIDMGNYFTQDEANAKFTLQTDFDALKTKVDGKVDKTSIITAKDSLATDDQVYSAKAINTELDGVVKKTDISTTIDSSSTDNTVPTNKSVWDSLYKICDPQVLVDANNPTSKICMADLTTLNTPAKEGITSAESSLIISIEGRDYWNGQLSIAMAESEVYVRSVREVDTWTKWRKLCSTNIKDVPKTIITNNLASTKVSLSNIDSYATYYVKNGTCYVTIWSMKILAACSVETIFNDLPKSEVGATCPLCNGEESFAQVFISPNSNVIAFNASAATINKNGYCSFSYPVAED